MALTALTKYPTYGTFRLNPAGGYPATIGAGLTWQSDLLPSGYAGLVAAVLMDQNGTLTVQRYADLAGTLPVGAAITQAITANTAAWAGANDGLPFLSFNVQIQNSGGVAANVSAASILTGPAMGV